MNLNNMRYLNVLLTLIVTCVFTISCSKEYCSINAEVNGIKLIKFPQETIGVMAGNTEQYNSFSRSLSFLKDSLWPGATGHTLIYETDEITSLQGLERYIYLGSLLKGGSLETQRYQVLINRVEPITISYSFPAKFVVDEIGRPSLSAMRQSIVNTMNNNGMSGKQLVSFSYDINQFTYYDELKLTFASNINVASILNITVDAAKGKIAHKTGLIAKFIQKNFTVDMDIPLDGNLLLDNDAINLMEGFSPVYISSITYGRMGVITMESNYGYNEVRLAVKAAFDAKIVNGNISISNEYKKIIDESNIKIYMVGGDGSGIAESVEGFAAFKKYIIDGGYYSPEVPGVPIAFTASYLMDNSPVYTKFKINIPN